MTEYPRAIQKAISELSRLPGIGTKTAERLVMFLLRKPKEAQSALSDAIGELRDNVHICKTCGYLTDDDSLQCVFCKNTRRPDSILCVVADVQTLQTIEKSRAFTGRYHVLGGTINPIEGISADMLNMTSLTTRIKGSAGKIKEVLLATGTDIEGEQTALYIAQLLKPMHVKLTRLARGIPRGTNLEYTDEMTLADAITNRQYM